MDDSESEYQIYGILTGSFRVILVIFSCAYYPIADLIIVLYASIISLSAAVIMQGQMLDFDTNKPERSYYLICFLLAISFSLQLYTILDDFHLARFVLGIFGMGLDCACFSGATSLLKSNYEQKKLSKILKE